MQRQEKDLFKMNSLNFNGLEEILTRGMQQVKIPNIEPIDNIREDLVSYGSKLLGKTSNNSLQFLNNYHKYFEDFSKLNDHRVSMIEFLNSVTEYKLKIYTAFKPIINELIGCDVAVQRRMNLVIQMNLLKNH